MTYSEVIESLLTSLLVNFDEIYHSAEIVSIEDKKFPAISLNDEWENLSPVDKKEIIYIRRNGDDEFLEDLRLSGCGRAYKMRTPLRIVFFRDHAQSHSGIISKLMQSVLITGTKLSKIISDKWKLSKDESTGQYNFGATTAYFAVDIFALWQLIPDRCEQDYCVDIKNPYKKQSCPAAV